MTIKEKIGLVNKNNKEVVEFFGLQPQSLRIKDYTDKFFCYDERMNPNFYTSMNGLDSDVFDFSTLLEVAGGSLYDFYCEEISEDKNGYVLILLDEANELGRFYALFDIKKRIKYED
mgnify:CR=1 FL=1